MDRIQRTRTKGSKLPPNTLCVTRGTLFGNPFKKHYARETGTRVVNLFEEWIHHPAQAKLRKDFIWACENMDIEHLACWCGKDEVCHADVWLEIWKGRYKMNDIELIKSEKFADNDFRAAAIATGCKLWECKTDAEKIARVRLYRDWRVSKIYGKETKPCFEKACAGVPVPMFEMPLNDLPFTDTSATPEDDTAAYHGQVDAV